MPLCFKTSAPAFISFLLLLSGIEANDDLERALHMSDECNSGQCALEALQLRAKVKSGGFVTNSEVRTFPWGPERMSASASWNAAFAGAPWEAVRFSEQQSATLWTREAVITWVEQSLLRGHDPFEEYGGRVPLPWRSDGEDQLAPGHYVGYSRRQLCYLTAKSLLGAETLGYRNGLLRFMDVGRRPARQGDFGRSWWLYLASCAADPNLKDGAQGPLVLVAKATDAPEVDSVKGASHVPLSQAALRVCQYGDGSAGGAPAGLQAVPTEGCSPPSPSGPGKDFMTGGLKGQATQDISASWLGGYVFGNADGLGGGQDERLMVYFPEVSILAFFLSQNPSSSPQLRQPAWILGARFMGQGLDGTARFNRPVRPNVAVPMTSDLETVTIGSRSFSMSNSRPFLAFMSENQDFLPARNGLHRARLNKEPLQRVVDGKFGFDKQVRAWYRSVALTSYAGEVQPILKSMVKSIGTGPWLAGLWFGDSHLGFLASWIGQAAAAATWGGSLALDYYIYSSFTENPGNQCFVHAGEKCQACLQTCIANPLTSASYWLPSSAYMNSGNPCVLGGEAYCPRSGIEDVVLRYQSKDAAQLWDDLSAGLRNSNDPAASTVFDLLMAHR